jgi:hypothetical protein
LSGGRTDARRTSRDLARLSGVPLGPGLIDQSQKMTVVAMQIADMKMLAQRS